MTFDIKKPGEGMKEAIQDKIDNLNKPKGSLGRLESLAMQVCLIQQTLTPKLAHPCHLLFGGDHGIEREGVSVSPREVTWQQMLNFANGGGGVNMFCRQHGFKLRIIDVGVDYDLSACPGIIDRKIARGTENFLYGPAMTAAQYAKALDVGAEMASLCRAEGCNVVCIGEMGIANTSPSSVWMNLLGGVPLSECVGAGAGLDAPGVNRKLDILTKAVAKFKANTGDCGSPETVIRHFGGFEMAAAVGAMLKAAELKMAVLVDGFIMTACALAATRLAPCAKDYMIFGHVGDENGHRRLLDLLGAKPLLNLGLRLGEGTGALCSYPIVDSAVRMINEMNDFQHAHITKYF